MYATLSNLINFMKYAITAPIDFRASLTGKGVCLLQITLVDGQEKLEEVVKELFGMGRRQIQLSQGSRWLQVSLEGTV
jgi:hypothetical protein